VETLRDLSISAGLVASTVTPGMAAPDESFTVPEIALCAVATDGNRNRSNMPTTNPEAN